MQEYSSSQDAPHSSWRYLFRNHILIPLARYVSGPADDIRTPNRHEIPFPRFARQAGTPLAGDDIRWLAAAECHITAPICHGTNSESPYPSSSDFVRSPEATASTFLKISSPFASIDTPSSTSPQLMSMSSIMRR
jgi:hypothetical protein